MSVAKVSLLLVYLFILVTANIVGLSAITEALSAESDISVFVAGVGFVSLALADYISANYVYTWFTKGSK